MEDEDEQNGNLTGAYSSFDSLEALTMMVSRITRDVGIVKQRLTKPSVTAANAGELATLASVEERLQFVLGHLTKERNYGSGQDQVGRQTTDGEDVHGRRQEQSGGDSLPGSERNDTFRRLRAAQRQAAQAYRRGRQTRRRTKRRRR